MEDEPQAEKTETDKDLELQRLQTEVDLLKTSMVNLLNGLREFSHTLPDASVSSKLYDTISKASKGITVKTSDQPSIYEELRPPDGQPTSEAPSETAQS